MTEPRDFFEYLETLDGPEKSRYDSFSRYLEAKGRRMNVPLFGQFELTPLCNLDCRMCYVHLDAGALLGRTLLTVGQWRDLMEQAIAAGMYEAALTGGECLTYPGFDDLYLYLQSQGVNVTVMSNGVLMDADRMAFFREHPPALVQITLYGSSEDAYERVTGRRVFRQVVDHIHAVREAGFPLLLTITPNRFSGEDVFKTIRLARSITPNVDISTSLFSLRDGPQREGSEDLDAEFYARILRFDRELRGLPLQECPESDLPAPGGPLRASDERGLECGGGRSGFVIDWQGHMRICNRLEVISEPMRVGFGEAWRIINTAACNWPKVPECQECPYKQVCNQCAARFLQHAEPGQQPAALCQVTRYMVSRGILSPPICERGT